MISLEDGTSDRNTNNRRSTHEPSPETRGGYSYLPSVLNVTYRPRTNAGARQRNVGFRESTDRPCTSLIGARQPFVTRARNDRFPASSRLLRKSMRQRETMNVANSNRVQNGIALRRK